jgi:hypothetical protein
MGMRATTPEETTTINHKWSTLNLNQPLEIPRIMCQQSSSNRMFTMKMRCHLNSITRKIYKGAKIVMSIMQIINQANHTVSRTHPQQILNWKKPVLLSSLELKIHQNTSHSHPNSTQTCLPNSTYKTLQGPKTTPPSPMHISMFPVNNNQKIIKRHQLTAVKTTKIKFNKSITQHKSS